MTWSNNDFFQGIMNKLPPNIEYECIFAIQKSENVTVKLEIRSEILFKPVKIKKFNLVMFVPGIGILYDIK